ncbi:MAG: hypothetical protein E7240_10165 [Lachnospiraceae bacterium]|nr:hypothetical protein [Lachnospiraceae bacterium]
MVDGIEMVFSDLMISDQDKFCAKLKEGKSDPITETAHTFFKALGADDGLLVPTMTQKDKMKGIERVINYAERRKAPVKKPLMKMPAFIPGSSKAFAFKKNMLTN